MESKLQLGFGRTDITPKWSVPLRGYGNTAKRMSTTVLDSQLAACLAFTDDAGETIVHLFADMTLTGFEINSRYRTKIAQAVGLPMERVHISVSHNHSGADIEAHHIPGVSEYCNCLEQALIDAAKEAMADRSPCQMYIAAIETHGLNFVRRYMIHDGSVADDNFGSDKAGIAGHETHADPWLQLVKFTRKDKQDIILGNFQMHPHRAGGSKKYEITSDIVGALRDYVEEKLNCKFAYAPGASGNVNGHSRVKEENITANYIEHGKALGAYAEKAAAYFRPVATGPLKYKTVTLKCAYNHTQDHLVPQAKEIAKLFEDTGNNRLCAEVGKPYGINSLIHNTIVFLQFQ